MFAGKNVLLLISGSIAAYKACELVRELKKQKADVHVVMSKSAQEFVTPLTFQTLSQNQVRTELFDVHQEGVIDHISLADQADVVLVAPATADIIARAAGGRADDLSTAVLLATKAPVVFAPAMNVNMWLHPLTQANVNLLRSIGYHFVEPSSGELACGWVGLGRLAEIETILEAARAALTDQDMKGIDVVVTAGTTCEPLDPIRFIANRSSGRMGYAVATDAHRRGASVTLISGPSALRVPVGVNFVPVESAKEMEQAVLAALSRPVNAGTERRLMFMIAAVSDHRPREPQTQKLKIHKGKEFALELSPNPDILQLVGERREELQKSAGAPLKLIGFAAETGTEEDLLETARDKLKRKRIDLIVGNLAQDSIGRETTRVWLVDSSGRQEEIAMADKGYVGSRIVSAALRV